MRPKNQKKHRLKEQGRHSLKEIAAVFLKLGCFGFGGPAVHIAMMEQEVVRKREWMSETHFLDMVGATNLIPGPNSTEMTMHCGHERGGIKGMMVAGACFIFPAVVITSLLAWLYQRYGSLPNVRPFIYGIKPAVVALIVAMMVSLGKRAVKSLQLAILAILAVVLALIGYNEIIILFVLGALGVLLYAATQKSKTLHSIYLPLVLLQVSGLHFDPNKWKIFWIFLKVGSLLYGSGYVLFAFLDAELVNKGMLARTTLVDAIAVGQITPGPVFSSATFIGWQMAGFTGALAATAGIFLPSFIFVAVLNPLIPKLRKSHFISSFLDAVNVAAIALILVVCLEMGKESLQDWRTILIAVVSFIIAFGFKRLNSVFLILGGAIMGFILSLITF